MKATKTVFASAARTASANSDDQIDPGGEHRGVLLTLDVSSASGTSPTLDVKVQIKDLVSGKYVDMPSASFAQKTGTGTDTLVIFPGIAETANRSVSDVISRVWRAVATVGGTTPSFTFTLSAEYLD